MEIAHFFIALLGIGALLAGLTITIVDWLIYTYLLRRVTERIRSGFSLAFGISAGTCVFLLTIYHIFYWTVWG